MPPSAAAMLRAQRCVSPVRCGHIVGRPPCRLAVRAGSISIDIEPGPPGCALRTTAAGLDKTKLNEGCVRSRRRIAPAA